MLTITPTSAGFTSSISLLSTSTLCSTSPFPPLHFCLSATPTVVQRRRHLNRCRARRQLTRFMPHKLVTQSIYAIHTYTKAGRMSDAFDLSELNVLVIFAWSTSVRCKYQ